MQNTNRLLPALTLAGLFALTGCSFPGVYKIDIQQGNVVTQDMVDQLKPGMTQRQVRFIMGSPLLADPLNANRWDYVYSIQPGGGQRLQERVTLTFSQDQLIGLAGDFMPGISRDQAILGETAPAAIEVDIKTPNAPAAKGSLLEQIQSEVDAAQPVAVPIPDPIEPLPQ